MKGQTLLEVLVALGAAAIIVATIASVVLSSLNNTQFSKNSNLATQYGTEGIEIVRQIRDQNYVTLATLYGSTYCLNKNATALTVGCAIPNVDNFYRTVTINCKCGGDPDIQKVAVTVAWTDNKCPNATSYCHSSVIVGCFSTVNAAIKP